MQLEVETARGKRFPTGCILARSLRGVQGSCSTAAIHRARCRLVACCLLSAVVASGCESEEAFDFQAVEKPPPVRLTRPEVRNIVRVVGQPSFIEAYERSSVYPKLQAYIEKWNVDIGDRVKEGQTLATLFVPELVEDLGTKNATVKLDKQRIELAKKVAKVAAADVKTAKARLEQAKAFLDKYKADVERWDIEVKRLTPEVANDVVDKHILIESSNQLKSSIAAREAAAADIEQADAELVSRKANLEKALVDIQVFEAKLAVAVSEAKTTEAWVGYLKLPAPFDGVIVVRNANTFDFVLPNSGDPSTMPRSPHQSPNRAGFSDLRCRPHRHRAGLRRHPRARRELRSYWNEGDGGCEGIQPKADCRQRHANGLGPQRQEPHAPRRDRLAQSRNQAPSRDVRLRQGDHRAPQCAALCRLLR